MVIFLFIFMTYKWVLWISFPLRKRNCDGCRPCMRGSLLMRSEAGFAHCCAQNSRILENFVKISAILSHRSALLAHVVQTWGVPSLHYVPQECTAVHCAPESPQKSTKIAQLHSTPAVYINASSNPPSQPSFFSLFSLHTHNNNNKINI